MDLGRAIGKHLKPGAVVELVGDLGGGKTTLAKGIAQGLGVDKTITSPTFSIQRSYELPAGGTLEHFDLYRLENKDLVRDELIECIKAKDGVVLVEWAKDFLRNIQPDRLIIEFHWKDDTTREIIMQATGENSLRIVGALQ